jgi:hypothetical protein
MSQWFGSMKRAVVSRWRLRTMGAKAIFKVVLKQEADYPECYATLCLSLSQLMGSVLTWADEQVLFTSGVRNAAYFTLAVTDSMPAVGSSRISFI